MRHSGIEKRMIVSALIASIAILILLPPSASAKEKEGAYVGVTKLDGRQIWGELLAVRQDSLLLRHSTDATIDLADIQSVRVVRKSQSGKLALGGFVAGAGLGVIIGIKSGDLDMSFPAVGTVLIAVALGAAGAGLGGLIGASVGTDTTYTIAGEPEADVKRRLGRLTLLSRESRLMRVPRKPGQDKM